MKKRMIDLEKEKKEVKMAMQNTETPVAG